MKPLELKPGLWWVGAVDWNKRSFHGYSNSPLGTTYNNFLIVDDKVTLVDTVDAAFRDHLFCSLAQVLGDRKIDYVVANHLEPDHSGCLKAVVERYKPEKIFTSPMGQTAMEAHYHYGNDWPVVTVPTGTEVSLGKRTLKFI
ncbi:MAG: MBL fold metallo-hydrolase, partial [Desulfovibrionaceae bacterium]